MGDFLQNGSKYQFFTGFINKYRFLGYPTIDFAQTLPVEAPESKLSTLKIRKFFIINYARFVTVISGYSICQRPKSRSWIQKAFEPTGKGRQRKEEGKTSIFPLQIQDQRQLKLRDKIPLPSGVNPAFLVFSVKNCASDFLLRLIIFSNYRMDIMLEFCGGAETHANGEKFVAMPIKSEPGELTVRDVFRKIRQDNVSLNLIISNG